MNPRLAPYLILICGLTFSAFNMLHNLDRPYLAPWDEIVHLNVVHNLYANCCVPKLHTSDLGTGISDWTNNYLWLHKPLLPFYLRAAIFHMFGESLFIFRFPSVVFALLTSLALFALAAFLSNAWVGAGVALLFAGNPFVFELAQGREFSDLSDVLNAFLVTLVLGITLLAAAYPSPLPLRWQSAAVYRSASLLVALFSALAFFCKGVLALPGLAVYALAIFGRFGRWGVGLVILMLAIFGALVLPGSLYLSHRFPLELHFEQRRQLDHLFTDVEGWSRPWDNYINIYWRQLLDLPLGIFGFWAMIACLTPKQRNRTNALLVIWILSYVVPLSFSVSNVENFILPILPAVLLLAGFYFRDSCLKRPNPVVELLLIIGAFYSLNILGVHNYAASLAGKVGERLLLPVLLLGILLLFALCWGLRRLPGIGILALPPRGYAAIIALLCMSVFIQNSRNNWGMSDFIPASANAQLALKETATRLRSTLPPDAVVLVDDVRLVNAHLYLQYWSRINSLPATQIDLAKRNLLGIHPLYVLAAASLPGATPIETVPSGYLYRLK